MEHSGQTFPDYTKYQGVRGWLLFLCISLTIINPFFILVTLLLGSNTAKEYFDRFPGLLHMVLIDGAMGLALMVFSLYAGILLWKVLPNAVSTAKKFFVAVFVYSIISVFLPFLVDFPEESFSAVLEGAFMNTFKTLPYVIIWYLYLVRSKRVKATYGIREKSETGGEERP